MINLVFFFSESVWGSWCDLTLPPHSVDSANPPRFPADDHDSTSMSLPARSYFCTFVLPTNVSVKSLSNSLLNKRLYSLLSNQQVTSLTCKQMLIVNDLFYKRSSLWWFLYEHISGLSSALLNHLHTGNWRWEYYSHVRPHYSVCKAQRHNWVSGTFNCNCSSTCRAIQDCTTSCQLFNKWGQISLPNRREDVFFIVMLLLPAQKVTADTGSRVFGPTFLNC